eukprot:Skav219829  [mRNA]  locus=scaffold1238:528729:558371:- [translate_table: standard]
MTNYDSPSTGADAWQATPEVPTLAAPVLAAPVLPAAPEKIGSTSVEVVEIPDEPEVKRRAGLGGRPIIEAHSLLEVAKSKAAAAKAAAEAEAKERAAELETKAKAEEKDAARAAAKAKAKAKAEAKRAAAKAKGVSPGENLLQRLASLQRHHSRPTYSEMATWSGHTQWNAAQWSTPKKRGKEKKPPAKNAESNTVKGYDGRKITMPWPQDGSSSSSAQMDAQEEVRKLREIMQVMASGQQLTPAQLGMLAADPMDSVRSEQKDLNAKRKRLSKIRQLEQRIQTSQKQFEDWVSAQKTLFRQEKQRYNEEVARMEKELTELKNGNMGNPEMEEDDLDLEDIDLGDSKMSAREAAMYQKLEMATTQAYHAQQAMLQMQGQMQQYMAFHAQQGAPSASTMPMETPFDSQSGTAHSPQLPKHVAKVRPGPYQKEIRDPKKTQNKKDQEDGLQQVFNVEEDEEETKQPTVPFGREKKESSAHGMRELRTVDLAGDLGIVIDSYLQQDEDAPTFVVPTADGWAPADYDDEIDTLPSFGGQVPDEVPAEGVVHAWRGCHEHFAHPNPTMAMIYVDSDDYERFGNAVTRIWPELSTDEWIHIDVNPEWKKSELLDANIPQIMIVNQNWYPATTTWRAVLLELKYLDRTHALQEHTILSMSVRTPTSKRDLLIQLGMIHLRSMTYLEVNGNLLRTADPPVLLAHGAFLFLELLEESEQDSQRTPGSLEPSLGSGSEFTLEGSTPTVDSIFDDFYAEQAVENLMNEIDQQPGNEADRTSPRSSSVESSVAEFLDFVSHKDSFTLSADSLTDPCTDRIEGRKPVVLNLADSILIEPPTPTKVDAVLGQQLASPQLTKDLAPLPPRKLNLELLVPASHPTPSPLRVPHAQTYTLLRQAWDVDLQLDLPEELYLHEATKDWLACTPTVLKGKLCHLHMFTDGSAFQSEAKAAWAFAAFASEHADSPLVEFRFLGWLAGPVITSPEYSSFCGATVMDSTSGEASGLFWAALWTFSMLHRFQDIHFHYDATVVGNAMFAHYNVPGRHAIVGFLRMLTQALEAALGPHRVQAHHVRAHQGHPLNEMVNSLAQWAACGHEVPLPGLNIAELVADDAFPLRWLWLHARGQQQPQSLPRIHDDVLWVDDIRQFQHTNLGPRWTFGYGSSTTTTETAFDLKLLTFNDLILTCPGTWTGLIKKAEKHALLQMCIRADNDEFHTDLLSEILAAYPESLLPRIEDRELVPEPFACLPCKQVFHSRTAWAVHAFRKHKRLARARYLADGTTCDHCHHIFLNEHRLYLHLRHSHQCFAALRHRGVTTTPVPGRGSRHWNQMEQYTLRPYDIVAGPRCPVPTDSLPHLAPHEEQLLLALTELEVHAHLDVEDWWLEIRPCLCSHPVSLEEMKTVLEVWQHFLSLDPMAGRRLRPTWLSQLLQAIQVSLHRLRLEWLAPELLPTKTIPLPDLDAQERLRHLSTSAMPHPGYGIRSKQPIFVHLYSGRRRHNDLQDAIEKLPWPAGQVPLVVSVDVVLNQQYGNILDVQTRKFWLQQAREGRIDGLALGPPCETWTTSRERWYEDFTGPRPIRNQHEPWGLPSLLISEAQQLWNSNCLMHFGLAMWYYQWLNGKLGILEHPAAPDPERHPTAATIWRTVIGKLFGSLEHATIHEVLQGYYDAASPKPTGLLTCHGPRIQDFAAFAKSHRSTHKLPPALRMGRCEDSNYWQTAKLKEYPAGFCAGALGSQATQATRPRGSGAAAGCGEHAFEGLHIDGSASSSRQSQSQSGQAKGRRGEFQKLTATTCHGAA